MNYKHHLLFGKKNFIVVLIGLGIMALGFLLMIGGSSNDPLVYNEAALYGFQRTILAPFLVLAGMGIQIIAIFIKSEDVEEKQKLMAEEKKKRRR